MRIDRFWHAARDAEADIRFVLETHVHNDYVSGGRILAGDRRPTGAARGRRYAFQHVRAFHLEDLPADAERW